MAASEAVKFFKESFVKQGFTDSSFQKWPKYKYKKKKGTSKRILYASGDLMRSVQKKTETTERVVVIADSIYAEIHNSGGTITKKDGTKIVMPKRQFMGNSKALMDHLESKQKDLVTKEMLNAFKKIRFK